jgi:hypothetical protein
MDRACISTLGAELKAFVEAWESANAGKVSAEKAAKSAEWLMLIRSRPSGSSP